MGGYIGVDLDGTLAWYDKFIAPNQIGAPIEKMVLRVKYWLAMRKEVRIVTARVFPLGISFEASGFDDYEEYLNRCLDAEVAKKAIEDWCQTHLGQVLKVQCFKDYKLYELWDDRAVQIDPNSGNRADKKDLIDKDIWKYWGVESIPNES